MTDDTKPVKGAGPDTSTVVAKALDMAAADARVHYLVVIKGGNVGHRITLGAKPMVIGRVEPADIVLPDAQISRNHCRIGMTLGEVFVTDLESSNGSFIDGQRIGRHAFLPVGGRLQVGGHVLEHELRSREEVKASTELDRDLQNASDYIHSLIPPQLESGPILTEWIIKPSAHLGGDVLGYHFVDPSHFAIYLLDVSGHGTGAAMHAVSVFNVLRRRNLPGVDAADPAQVARYLNDHFQMHTHGGLYFTLWYGVYDLGSRTIAYCSAGHHASYLVPPGRREARALRTRSVSIGVKASVEYVAQREEVPPGSSLYVFSDGVFEIETRAGTQWSIDDLVIRLTQPAVEGKPEIRRLYEAVVAEAKDGILEDDFSMVMATFG